MKILNWIYPSLVGIFLGLLQTGLFFQLAFTLSSSFKTFLMVTVSWLIGSVIGIRIARQVRWSLNTLLTLAIVAYFGCVFLLSSAPFNTQLWVVYAVMIVGSGVYPGVFFVRLNDYYSARSLFLKENNGFILGLVGGTMLFLLVGRIALWSVPLLMAGVVMVCTSAFLNSHARSSSHEPLVGGVVGW